MIFFKRMFMLMKIIKVIVCIFILVFIPCICIAENSPSLYTYGDLNMKETKINMQVINGENVIVMPSNVSPDEVSLFGDFPDGSSIYVKNGNGSVKFSSGMKINLNDYETDGMFRLDFADKNEKNADFYVKILFSENVPAVYLVSDNPKEKGREWVEASADKSNKATGFMVMQNPGGETVYSGELTQIKGRGNSTWSQVKKPYQIKLSEKADLLQTENSDNKSKTWLLLANYLDASLLNNSIVLGLGKDMGMKSNIENTHIDLYYDGEFRGSYLLSEKAEVGSGRVDIVDLEEKNSDLNEEKEEYPIKTAVTANGAEYTYCDGMVSPEDVSGGYLLEMDYEVRAKEEICYFKTTRNQYVVVKSPELASKEEMEYIASLYQQYEDAVFNGGVNPDTKKAYSDYVDRESIATYYLLNEFSKARDFFGSSAYLYKNSGEEKMYMGPLWDYDLGFTETRFDSDGEETPYGLSIYNTAFGAKLSEIDDFSVLLESTYQQKLLPLIKEGLNGDFKKKSDKIKTSAMLNSMIWHTGENAEEKAVKLLDFIRKRADYLDYAFAGFSETVSTNRTFIDVLKKAWYFDFVNSAHKMGYMNGVNEICFDPYSPVRRSEAAQVIFNMSGENNPVFRELFSDVKAEDWFSPAVIWCADKGIMTEYTDGNFLPARYITREELVNALYLYKNPPRVSENLISGFYDWEKVSVSYADALNWAIKEGIVQGDGNGCLNPHQNLTRAELAAILVRLK